MNDHSEQGRQQERIHRRQSGQPLLGVGAIVFEPTFDKVLLIERGAPPSAGLWSVPGGLVERGEGLIQACERELLEETGLLATLDPQPVKLIDRILRAPDGAVSYHFLIVDFWAEVRGGELRAASDAAAARWTPLEDVAKLGTTAGLSEAIERARCVALGGQPESPLLKHIDTPEPSPRR